MDLLSPDLLNTLAESGPAVLILLLGGAVSRFMRGDLRTGRDRKAAQQERDDGNARHH